MLSFDQVDTFVHHLTTPQRRATYLTALHTLTLLEVLLCEEEQRAVWDRQAAQRAGHALDCSCPVCTQASEEAEQWWATAEPIRQTDLPRLIALREQSALGPFPSEPPHRRHRRSSHLMRTGTRLVLALGGLLWVSDLSLRLWQRWHDGAGAPR